LPIQTTKIFFSFFDLQLCPLTEKGSATYVHMPSCRLCRSTGQKRQNWYDLAT